MPEIQITDCHVHLFTHQHVPEHFPFRYANWVRSWTYPLRALAGVSRLVGQEDFAENLKRLERFRAVGAHKSQQEVLEVLLRQYPDNTRLVVLPMAMDSIGYGAAKKALPKQHEELAELAQNPQYDGRIIPFATCHPDDDFCVEEARKCLRDYGFAGLKLYPKLGYRPDHPTLMQDVYPALRREDNSWRPVLSHCSRGGLHKKGLGTTARDRLTHPTAFVPVMQAFPELQINLAHFGGLDDWNTYIKDGVGPQGNPTREENYLTAILDMIRSGSYPNLWTDISYTIFEFGDHIPLLQVFMEDPHLSNRILFGSDFYMTRQEKLSVRSICFRLRASLGEEKFRQIAQTNPQRWLGELSGDTQAD